MSRRTTIPQVDLLEKHLETETNLEIRQRLVLLNVIAKLDRDIALARICDMMKIPESTAYVWIRAWKTDGYRGIAEPFHRSDDPPGRPPKLDDGQLAELKGLLRSKDYWETREVRELIETTWGVTLSASQVARILKGKLRMHFSKPYPRDYRRPEDAESRLRASLDDAYRKLSERGVATERVAIGCLDESSPQTTSNRVRLWHFEHPRFIKNTDRMKSNTIGFYAITGTSVHDFMADSTAPSIADFLERVRDANREFDAVIIVLDRFPSHRARLVRERAEAHRMELVYLPAYSPDINPIEFIWKTVKRAVSVTFVHTLTDLRDVISAAWNQAACQPTYARAWTEKFLESRVQL